MLDTYTLTFPVFGAGGNPVEGAVVTATLSKPDYTIDGVLLPKVVEATSNEEGVAELALVSNLIGTQDSRYHIAIRSAAGKLIAMATVQMPKANTSLPQLVDAVPITPEYSTAAALSAAIASAAANQTSDDAEQTALDRIATGEDRIAVAEDKGVTNAARNEAVQAAERINTLYWLGV